LNTGTICFWAAIKSKKQESTGVAQLKNKEDFIHSDTTSKAEILNEQFQSVYTKENTSTMPDKGPASEYWYSCVKIGASSSAALFSINDGIQSGPVGLDLLAT
jgi:hypothetical protein